SPVALDKRMDPVHPPQRIRGQDHRVRDHRPVLMHHREKPVHLLRHGIEMRRQMVPNINRALPIPPAELCNVRHGRCIQRPERVFVERLDALRQANLDAVQQQIVLPQEISLLDLRIQLWRIFLSNGHVVVTKFYLIKQAQVFGGVPHAFLRDRVRAHRISERKTDALLPQLIIRHPHRALLIQQPQKIGVRRPHIQELLPVRHKIPALACHYSAAASSALIFSSASTIISHVTLLLSIFAFPYAKLRRCASRSASGKGRLRAASISWFSSSFMGASADVFASCAESMHNVYECHTFLHTTLPPYDAPVDGPIHRSSEASTAQKLSSPRFSHLPHSIPDRVLKR